MKILQELLEFKIINLNTYSLSMSQVMMVLLIILITKILLKGVQKAIAKSHRMQTVAEGNREAIFQMLRYFIWIVSIILCLEGIGVKINVLIASSAALLVGLGLGLQQLFNDIVSGIILLIEGTVRVGDVLEIDGQVVKVNEIGLRTSEVLNRDDISVMMPNSKMVNDKVINWSHQTRETRFHIKVGVAYGSNVELVCNLLEQAAIEHPQCSNKHKAEARFIDFGESSLDFEVLFWSDEMFRIERIKSDIRKSINRKFIENKVEIPFPQRDLHIKTSNINLPL